MISWIMYIMNGALFVAGLCAYSRFSSHFDNEEIFIVLTIFLSVVINASVFTWLVPPNKFLFFSEEEWKLRKRVRMAELKKKLAEIEGTK